MDKLDERGFDWARTSVYGVVGGEGMTEALRDYLERRFVKVRSGYGACDLQIGMAGETDLSVWLRKLRTDAARARALLGPASSGCRWSSSTTRSRTTSRPTPATRS